MRRRHLDPAPGIDPAADALAERLRAVADPLRLRILALLARGECPVGLVAAAVGAGQSLVSFHLGVLREAGLVEADEAGRRTNVRLAPGALPELFAEALALAGAEAAAATRTPASRGPVARVVAAARDPYERVLGRARVERVAREEAARRWRLDPPPSAGVLAVNARERLRALAQAEGRIAKPVPEVLFVCAENAGRSQMAAAIANGVGGGRVHAWSAGSRPAPRIPPEVRAAMREAGLDLAGAVPKPLTNDLVRAADVVVAMGCGEDVPRFPGVRYLDWPVADPAGRPVAEVARIREDIARRVRRLARDLERAAGTGRTA